MFKKITLLVCIMSFYGILAFGQNIYTIETIPDPKSSPSWNYVSDPDNILGSDGGYLQLTNALCKEIEDSTTVQIAVVAVNSIGDQVPVDFVHALFNYWRVGQADKNNGLMLLIVNDQHRWEFETGYGLEPVLTDGVLFNIGTNHLTPNFKNGHFGQGVFEALQEVKKIVIDPTYAADVTSISSQNYSHGSNNSNALYLIISGFGLFFSFFLGIFHINKRVVNKSNTLWKKFPSLPIIFTFLSSLLFFIYLNSTYQAVYLDKGYNFLFVIYGVLCLFFAFYRLQLDVVHGKDPDALEDSRKKWSYWIWLFFPAGIIYFPLNIVFEAIAERKRKKKENPDWNPKIPGSVWVLGILSSVVTFISFLSQNRPLLSLDLATWGRFLFIVANVCAWAFRIAYNARIKKKHTDAFEYFKEMKTAHWKWMIWFIAFPFATLFYLPFYFIWYISKLARFRPRTSDSGIPMRRLDEEKDNELLEKGQITEEVIKSIDYDVWVTDDLKEVKILKYPFPLSVYSKCPSCKYKTYYVASTTVISQATYSSSGLKQMDYLCKNCGFKDSKTVVIPKLVQSSSGGSGSFSGGGGGGGGSSWGGGSSGGGGAGGSW